jgi:hypothetical protein
MISALLVKEDFVLITAGNKYACRAISIPYGRKEAKVRVR